MKRIGLFAWVFLVAAPVWAASAEQALTESRALAAQQKYDAALAVLEKAENENPQDGEIKIAIIRALSWQGNYDAAEKKLNALGKQHEKNADVQLLRANLAYYRKDYAASEKIYRQIVQAHPDYMDAREGLARIERVRAAPEAADYRWQVDAGYEYSSFSRRRQPAWNQESLQLTHFVEPRKTTVHARFTRYDQFTNIDSELEAGINHAFADYLNAYVYGALTPDADFRPKRRIAGGGALRVVNGDDGLLPLWLTIDSRYDTYDGTRVLNANPGVRAEFYDGWALAARLVMVDQQRAKRLYGQEFRLDGTLSETLRFYAGYADAPETVAAITVNTRTYFGGLAYDVDPQTTLRLGYTHDDRENSYIREVVNASVSYRF